MVSDAKALLADVGNIVSRWNATFSLKLLGRAVGLIRSFGAAALKADFLARDEP